MLMTVTVIADAEGAGPDLGLVHPRVEDATLVQTAVAVAEGPDLFLLGGLVPFLQEGLDHSLRKSQGLDPGPDLSQDKEAGLYLLCDGPLYEGLPYEDPL